MDKISIIVPCFNEEEVLPLFYQEINKISEQMAKKAKFEIIFVDDGSSDKTLEICKSLAKKDKKIHYVTLSRNFGKEGAMFAGLEYASGDFVAIMDADLQDPPALISQMYDILKNEDYDCVGTRRVTRKGEPPIRSFFARRFYKLINKISKTEMVDGARDFRLMSRQMVNAILQMPEYNRYSKGLFSFVGFKTKWLEYENVQRAAGKTKWNFWKLLLYAFDGIIAFSTAPLMISVIIGILFCFISFLMIIVIIVKTLCFGDPVGGWPSMVCIMFFLSGIQLFCTGVMGAYLSKTYLETKKRPIYIIKDSDLRKED